MAAPPGKGAVRYRNLGSPNAPNYVVAADPGPVRAAPEQGEAGGMVAAGLGDVPAATGDDEDPRPKRRRLRRVCRTNTDSEGEENECPPAEYTVTRILGRRGQGPSQE
uniref:Uncharacterized protein n=1 Tax=Peronospora matthiolae TaxID=2874970 RepID=A0AAV1UD25_9STRA